ncbi:MAG: hypothetical protein ACI33J_02605 [Clostridium sp.]
MKRKIMAMVAFTVLLSNLYGCGDMVNVPYTNSVGSNIEEDLKAENIVTEIKVADKDDKEVKVTEEEIANLVKNEEDVINNSYHEEDKENTEENIEEEKIEEEKLSEEDARDILNNAVNTDKYEVEINNNNFIYEGREWYQYIINYDDITSQYSLIVDKETGEIKCYRVDGLVCDFEGSMFSKDYDESLKEPCDWDGEYYLKDGDGILNISETNKDSFKFNIYGDINDKKLENINGVAKTVDNVGNYTYDNGEILNFIIGNGYIEINRFNTLGETVFHGLYFPKDT